MTIIVLNAEGAPVTPNASDQPTILGFTSVSQSFETRPDEYGLLGYSEPPWACNNSVTPAAGVMGAVRFPIPDPWNNLGKIYYTVNVAGSGATLPSNVFFGIANAAGTLVAQTADQGTAVQTTGVKSAAVTAISGQSLTQFTGGRGYYAWLLWLAGTQGTTPFQLRCALNSGLHANVGLTAASPFRSGTTGAGLTALANFTPTALTAGINPWLAAGT